MTTETLTTPTVDSYHADYSRDSHSSLRLFRESVERYAAIRVHRTMQPPEPTPAMLFGQAFDCLLLEPDTFPDRFAMALKCDRRTNAGKAAWKEWEAENAGKGQIEADDLNMMQRMKEAVYRNRFGRRIMEDPGQVQRVIEWTDEETGLPCKMRSDKILSDGLIVDLKTAAAVDPSSLSRSAASYGYHTQAAFYLRGAETAGISGPFVFLAVCKEPPHEVVCYALDDAALHLGQTVNDDTLADLAGRKVTGDWSGRWGNVLQTVALPKWAFV